MKRIISMKHNKILAFLTLILTLFITLTIFAACGTKEEPRESGDEVGVYYCEVSGNEWTITLSEKCTFTRVFAGETKAGTYVLEGGGLSLLYDGETEPELASLENEVITYSYNGTSYRFLLKKDLTVTFMADGSVFTTTEVLNGKPVAKPAEAPEKANYVFVGWYSDSANKNYYNFERPVTAALTLYARFVDKVVLDPEYTVAFDLRYENAPALPEMQTQGGRLYEGQLPAPEREGDSFVGWWVSNYNSADKLTYQYNEHLLNGDITLYAVWASDAPFVSIEGTKIVWSAEGVNNSYTVTFKDPDGNEIYSRTSGATSYDYNFAQAACGDYTVEVTLNGHTTTAYYRNKELAKATSFRVEGSTLLFNPVENAQNYVLSYQCGTVTHNHSAVDLGEDTFYNFENCDLPEDGFVFVVTASSEGWISSVSEEFTFTRTLDAVADLTVDADSDLVSWAAVDSATSYYLTLSLNGEEIYSGNVGDVLSFDLTGYDPAAYTVTVYPIARGWKSPAASTAEYTKTRLATPKNLHLDGMTVAWDSVTGATKYEVKIGDKVYEFTNNSFEFTDEYVVTGQNSFPICVRALGTTDAVTSVWTAPMQATQEFEDSLAYEKGVLSWDPALGVAQYVVKVNDGEETFVERANSTPVTLTKAGENVISVAAVLANGDYSAWRTVTVTAYAVEFDAQGGVAVSTQYHAKGDPLDLPATEKTGYIFSAWYDTAEGSGASYTDKFFNEETNLTLYAAWIARSYKVSFDVGVWGEALDPDTVDYGTDYNLSVPDSKSVEMAFAGWYSAEKGGGTQYTDYSGKSIRSWSDLEERTLYAQWVEIYKFTEVTGGYSVEKGEGIAYVAEITIPQEHDGKTVVTINDFSGVTTLKTVTFYDTVQNITVGSIGIAFEGCKNLESIFVVKAAGTHTPRYWDVDGVLLGKDTTTGDTLIYFYPAKHKLVENTYYIPDGVTKLSSGVFNDTTSVYDDPTETTLVTIVVPASVTNVGYRAFYKIYPVRTITFLDPEDPEDAQPLTIADNAFEAMNGLETINFPARLANFSTDVFHEESSGGELSRLRSVTVAEGSEKFAMVEGFITAKTTGNGRELLYYPTPRRLPVSESTETGYHYTTAIVIPEGITSIASDVLLRGVKSVLSNIESITIAATVTEIKDNAFSEIVSSTSTTSGVNRTGLKELIFLGTASDKPLTIGARAFYADMCLGEASSVLTLPENLAVLGEYAFGNIPGITIVNVNCGANYGLNFANNAFATDDNNGKHTSYIEVVNFGKDVQEVQIAGVFGGNVKAVNIDDDNPYYKSVDGVVFDKEMTTIVFFPDIKTEFTVPESITAIGANLFSGRTTLESIIFSANLTEIGENAFKGCTSLALVTFLEGGEATTLTIGNGAFNGCSALKTIELPARTVSIGSNAFSSTALTSITLNEGLTSIGESAFSSTNLASVTLPASLETLGTSTASSSALNKLGTSTLSSNTGTINMTVMYVFNNCKYLEEIKVEAANEHYASVDGVLYGKDENGAITELIYCPRNYEGDKGVLNVPASVNKVWSYAFNQQGNTNNYANTKYLTEIRFPEKVAELVIEPEAFSLAYMVETVTLPEGLTEIKELAFYNMSNFTSITIPNTVTRIGSRAFFGLANLESVIFAPGGDAPLVLEGGYNTHATGASDNLTGDGMFASCPKLTAIELPARLVEIGAFLFQGSSITSVFVPAGVTTLGVGAFAKAEKLTSVTFAENSEIKEIPIVAFLNTPIASITLPAGVQTIQEKAFYGTESLISVTLNSALKSIGTGAFYSSAVRTVNFPEGLETIGNQAFTKSGLTGVVNLPASLKTIGEQAFGSNSTGNGTAITNVVFAENSQLETIGDWAFGFDVNLVSVTGLGTKLQTIGNRAFANCVKLNEVSFAGGEGVLNSIGIYAFQNTALTSFSVPESSELITLGANLFDGIQGLTLHLSQNVQKVDNAFLNVTIEAITITDGNLYFSVDPDQPIVYDSEYSIVLIYGELDGKMTLRGKNVAAGAFTGQTGITEIVISSTILSIGANAFQNCTNLVTVTIDNGSALESIGNYAFQNCSALTTIQLENTSKLTTFGTYVFDGCSLLQSVDLSKNTSLTKLGNYGFRNTSSMTSAKLPNSLTFLGSYGFQNSGLTAIDLSQMSKLVQLSNSATGTASVSAAAYTFAGCADLASVKLPAGLQRIGGFAFQNCANLTAITLPAGLILIGNSAFYGTKLTEVTIPGTVTTVGSAVFADIDTLNSVVFQDGSKAITFTAGTNPLSTTRSTFGTFEGSAVSSVTLNGTTTQTLPTAMFYNCKNLTSITIPSGVTTINQGAFQATALTSVTIPNTVKTLGANTFADCESLKTVVFEGGTTGTALSITAGTAPTQKSRTSYGAFEGSAVESVTLCERIATIPIATFYNCENLTSITIPSSVTAIKQGAFQNCTSLASVTFEDASVITFDTYVFQNCGFKSFEIPAAKAIGNYFLMGNANLETVTFAEGVTTTGNYTFQNCTNLTSVTLNGITTIGYGAFRNTGLISVTIPSSVTTFSTSSTTVTSAIGHQFAECANLESVTFADGIELTALGVSAFADCAKLNKVVLPAGVKDLGYNTFSGCTLLKLDALPTGVTTLTAGVYQLLLQEGATSFTVPAQITAIGDYAFDGSSLTSIVLHNGIESIGQYAFRNAAITGITLPEGLVTIGNGAFQGSSLTSVSLPASLEKLGTSSSAYVFDACASLESVTFPTEIKYADNKLLGYMFRGCTSLSRVTLPENLQIIGSYAFQNCSALKSINVPATVTLIDQYAFTGSGLTSIDLSALTNLKNLSTSTSAASPAPNYSSSIFKDCAALEEVKLPDSVQFIGASTFEGCTSLTSITLPANLITLGNNAFYGCTSLTEVKFNAKLQIIGTKVFQNCTSLASVDLSETSVKWIGATSATSAPAASAAGYVFAGCTSLAEVKLSSNTVVIAGYTFQGCTSLKTVALPDNVTVIGNSAFDGSGIEHVELPANLATLGTTAFQNCTNLKSVYIPSTVTFASPAAAVFNGCSGFTIYTDMTADAFATKFANWASFTVVGETEYQTYLELIKDEEPDEGEPETKDDDEETPDEVPSGD